LSQAEWSDPLGVAVSGLVGLGGFAVWRMAGVGLIESASWVLPLTAWNLTMWLVVPNPFATIGLAIGAAVLIAMLGWPPAAERWLRLIERRRD
jgi:hypothetical protein